MFYVAVGQQVNFCMPTDNKVVRFTLRLTVTQCIVKRTDSFFYFLLRFVLFCPFHAHFCFFVKYLLLTSASNKMSYFPTLPRVGNTFEPFLGGGQVNGDITLH